MAAEPSKVNGQVNSAIGTAKEGLGAAIETVYQAVGGSTEPSTFTTAGREQRKAGDEEVKAAEAKNYVDGLGDRIEGKKDSIVGAVTGDKSQQLQGNVQHDKGATQMQANS